MTRLARTALLAALLALGAAGAAQASSVSARAGCDVGSKDPRLFCDVIVDFAAAPGERNLVTIAAGDGAVVEDRGAPLTAAQGCVQRGPHEALCRFGSEQRPDVLRVSGRVDAGDGDDDVRVPADGYGSWVDVDGGLGDDRLQGGVVTYADRTAPVVVDLATGSGGQAGEHDLLSEIDGVRGGAGDDVIVSDRRGGLRCFDDDLGRANLIWGGPGDDRIAGGGGADCVMGDSGDDRIAAGAGRDWADGGPGSDRVTGGGGSNVLYGGPGPRPPHRRRLRRRRRRRGQRHRRASIRRALGRAGRRRRRRSRRRRLPRGGWRR